MGKVWGAQPTASHERPLAGSDSGSSTDQSWPCRASGCQSCHAGLVSTQGYCSLASAIGAHVCRPLDCAPMTTREYLRARVIHFYSRIWPIVSVSLVMAIWARRSTLFGLLVLIAITALLTAYIVVMRRTPCLRCSTPLRNAALNWGSNRQPAPRCPHCGLDIDEQVADPPR